jgi:hypothetical protein
MLCLGAIIICSCKKSENDEVALYATNDAAQFAYHIRIGMTNWMKTNAVYLQTNGNSMAIAKDMAETGPESVRMAMTNEVFLETERAGLALQQIYEQERLPGVAENDQGNIGSDTLDLIVSNKLTTISYPALRKFHLVKDGETFTNYYILVKQTKAADWKLQKAWRSDSNGQIIQEWPVK